MDAQLVSLEVSPYTRKVCKIQCSRLSMRDSHKNLRSVHPTSVPIIQ